MNKTAKISPATLPSGLRDEGRIGSQLFFEESDQGRAEPRAEKHNTFGNRITMGKKLVNIVAN